MNFEMLKEKSLIKKLQKSVDNIRSEKAKTISWDDFWRIIEVGDDRMGIFKKMRTRKKHSKMFDKYC